MATMTLSPRISLISIAFGAGLPLLLLHPAEAARGYQSRACSFDMNHNGIIGECRHHSPNGLGSPGDDCPDCHVCDGVTRDPDGDGNNENMIYVDCNGGTDTSTCGNPTGGSPNGPCRTINQALNTRTTAGVQNIVCFRGTCSNEPDGMSGGPDGLSTANGSWPSGVAASCNTNPYYTRVKSGNEVRDFRYACNPTMLIGWDFNNNGDYPPHDTADTAVVSGAGKNSFIRIQNPNYREFAHFTVRDYARVDLGASPTDFKTTWDMQGTHQPGNEVYLHDIENININRGNQNAPFEGGMIFPLWNTAWTYAAFENLLCQDCAGNFFRGGEETVVHGPIRFKNMTWRAHGGSTSQGGGAIGAKVYGTLNGWEWLDNIWDMNLANWTPGDYHFTYCLLNDMCSQGIDIINNEFIDCGYQSLQFQVDAGAGYCQSRPIDNVNVVRNIFRNTRALVIQNQCCTNFIKLQGALTGSPSTAYINNVTIADNFFSTTQTGESGMTAAVLSAATRNGVAIPGTITIANNTFNGDFQSTRSCGCTAGVISTNTEDGSDGGQVSANNYIVRDNVFSGINGISPSYALNIQTRPSNFRADHNTYDPRATFVWNGGSDTNLATWRTNLGGCPGTDRDCNSLGSCVPSYVNAANGNFHLNTADTCARGHGADLSSILSGFALLDIDGDSRPRGSAWDVGADQAGLLLLSPPRLLEVVPLTP